MIRGVIFDFDGVIVDTEIVSYRIYKKILSDFGHDFTKYDYAYNFSGKTEEKNVNNLIDQYKLPLSFDECFDLVISTEKSMLAKGVDLKAGVNELLTYLNDNNIKMVVASSSTRERAINILEKHDIKHYFEGFVFAEDISKSKPNPEIFTKANELLGFDKEECLVIEDSENGILAGYSAGIPVICVPDMKMPKDEYLNKTKHVVNSLEDIIKIIDEINS